jgi:uncharacterized protein
MGNDSISISVVYALADRQDVVKLMVERGTTVAAAVELSGLAQKFVDIGSQPLNCAIYSRIVEPTHIVREGDRIEILRPLLIDPKEHRRQVAAKSKAKRS